MNVKSYFFDGARYFLPAIVEIMLAAVVVRLLGMVQPFAMQAIIDRVLPFQRNATLDVILILLVLNTLFSSTLQSLMSYTGGFVGNAINGRVATRVFKHVVDLPLMQIQRYQVGDILSRVGEISNITQFYAGKVPNILIEIAFFFIYFIILFGISSQLGLIILLYLPIQMAFFFALDRAFGPELKSHLKMVRGTNRGWLKL